jgi:hypothetical protein
MKHVPTIPSEVFRGIPQGFQTDQDGFLSPYTTCPFCLIVAFEATRHATEETE